MPALWGGPLGDLSSFAKRGDFAEKLTEECRAKFGEPSPAELRSWVHSLPRVLSYLSDSSFEPLQGILELQMPVGAERADLVLIGGPKDSPRGYILELKQWSSAMLDPESCEIDVEGFGLHQHPVAQVLNYQGKLSLFNERAAHYTFGSGAYFQNLRGPGLGQLLKECAEALPRTVQLFGMDDGEALAQSIGRDLLPAALASDEHGRLANARFHQSAMLFDVLKEHASDIANRAVATLAEAGVGLTEAQEQLVERALAAARRRTDEVFLVEGGPGSGKTLVAVHLLLRAIREDMSCVLAIRNNRLQAILKRCFDIAFPGASGVLMYFEVPGSGTGIGDKSFQGRFDLVICDEAQRMREASMETVLERAPTSVIFLDETQRLNPREQGTVSNFSSASLQQQKSVVQAQLPSALRCRGGQPYHDWVDLLLNRPDVILSAEHQPWRPYYDFGICSSMDELTKSLMKPRREDDLRVAMVASFTESPGSIARVGDPDNARVGFPLTSGWDFYKESNLEIRWLMKPSEYVSFWMRGKSNALDRVASIYGTQGFEADYVGIVWGRDLILRDGQWELGDPSVCYDTIDGLVTGRRRESGPRWASEALELVKNRYRIFLTRGIHGTFVFFEDGETREALRRAH